MVAKRKMRERRSHGRQDEPIPLDDGQLDEVAGGISQEDFSTYRYECRDCGTVFISEENRAHVEASGRKCPFCGLTMEFIGVIG